ncbi:MAG TPA: asparagine synthase C-terminal domain-containing protein [Casimicrobiaceae bacterium]|nr:asparagine synthase C-terminal domain-containing protein [Casimicrobiaceae bacterium]
MNRFSGHFLSNCDALPRRSVTSTVPDSRQFTTLSITEPGLAIRLDLATVSAVWHREGARSLLALGLRAGSFGTRSSGEASELIAALAADAASALLRLRGGWMLLFVDESRERCLLAADRAATRPPCFASLPDRFVFGLTALDVASCDERLDRVRPQAIFDYLRSHFIPAPATMFDGVERLLPGEYVDVNRGTLTRAKYWSPRYDVPTGPFDFEARSAEFRQLLEASVRSEADGAASGAFLSGGTDSSTIAGMLGRVTGAPAKTYSIGFDAAGFDEMAYARIAAKHFGTAHHEYYVTPGDLVQSIPEVATAYDQPFGNSSALPAYYCARLGRGDGVTRMLGGDGGDELFGGNTRYARQKLFDAYSQVPAWLKSAGTPLLQSAVARSIPLLRKAGSYVEQARVPMPARLQTYNLLMHVGADRLLTPEFLEAVDTSSPAQEELRYYETCASDALVNRMLYFDWKYTLADNDLPKVVGTANLAGVAVGFPMLNEELAAFANRLPVAEKVRRLQLRHFFKAALHDFLPPPIIAKKKHGFGLPFGVWLVSHEPLRRFAFGTLDALRSRGIVRTRFFDELLKARLDEHPSYYGELVWIMMMLEQWFQAHRPGYVYRA